MKVLPLDVEESFAKADSKIFLESEKYRVERDHFATITKG